jgi:hypothetical protein
MSLMLGSLASTIVAEVPVLLERTLKQDTENTILQQHCNQLKNNIDSIKNRIEEEREKQQQLRVRLLKVRGPPPSRSESIRERKSHRTIL